MSRDLDAARKAYIHGNIEMSKNAHVPLNTNENEN